MKSSTSGGHREHDIDKSFECCQLTSCANPGLCFHMSNPTCYLFHRGVVPPKLEIRGRGREGKWRCPSYNTRQSLALELGLPPLLHGLEEGNQGTHAKFTLPKTSDILCWSALQKLWWDSCNSCPVSPTTNITACTGTYMTSISIVCAIILNGTLVFVDEENAQATRNRNFCIPRQGFPHQNLDLFWNTQSYSAIILPEKLLAQVPTALMQFRYHSGKTVTVINKVV